MLLKKKYLIGIIIQGDKVENNNTNRKSFSIRLPVLVAIILVFFVCVRYTSDSSFKKKMDTKVLKKEVAEQSLKTIEINSDNNPISYAYDSYIVVLAKNKLTEYDSNGVIVAELDVNISIPLFASNGKYLVLADKDAKNIYLISGSSILWKNSVDGDISQINVNKNGYVSIIIKNTIYKSIVLYYDSDGKEIFRDILSSNYATCSCISSDNKYLAVGEIDYSGTIIKSSVKIISAELAQSDPNNSIVYTYNSDNNEVITNINYQNNYAICMFTDYVQKISPTSDERLYDFTSDDLFVDINSKNHMVRINKQSSGLFSYEYGVSMINTSNNSESLYILNSDLPKSIYATGNNVLLNLGNEVHIINTSGWLIKKYLSTKQVNSIIMGDSIAGIIYKNKIEIIDF